LAFGGFKRLLEIRWGINTKMDGENNNNKEIK